MFISIADSLLKGVLIEKFRAFDGMGLIKGSIINTVIRTAIIFFISYSFYNDRKHNLTFSDMFLSVMTL